MLQCTKRNAAMQHQRFNSEQAPPIYAS